MTTTGHRSAKAFLKLVAVAALVPLAGFGCSTGKSGPIFYSMYRPDGYYTGKKPEFAERANPDPAGRKFRVAHLFVELVEWKKGEPAKKCARPVVHTGLYLPLRQDAAQSPLAQRIEAENAGKDARDLYRALYGPQGLHAKVLQYLTMRALQSQENQHFYLTLRHNTEKLNAALAERYPNLFSTSEDAFPVEVLMMFLSELEPGTQRHPLCEGWIIGLPEHADLKVFPDGSLPDCFPAKEGFLNPYDAIAGSLFKLTDEQFGSLKPSNPKDYDWIDKKN